MLNQTSFKWLNRAQTIGALNDNLFKMVAVIFASSVLKQSLPDALAFATVLLVLPFVLFSNIAGALADRHSKRSLVITAKWAELSLMLLAFPALASERAWPIYSMVFLLATQSTLFGPVKRGIVPELVDETDLAAANGKMTAFTYLGIIVGLFIPSLLTTFCGFNCYGVLAVGAALSVYGLFSAYRIDRVPAQNPAARVTLRSALMVPDTVAAFRAVRGNTWLWRAAWGSVLFNAVAALFQQNLVLFAEQSMGLTVEYGGYLFFFLAVGIALGSWFTAKVSTHRLESGVIPWGVLLLSAGTLVLALAHTWIVSGILLVLAGFGAGCWIVPMTTHLQSEAPAERRGEIFGAVEFASCVAMILAAGLVYLFAKVLGLGANWLLALSGFGTLLVALWAFWRLSYQSLRFAVTMLTHCVYKVEIKGMENLPVSGGAMVVMNHTAYSDCVLIQAITQRPIRYVMSREIYGDWTWCRLVFNFIGAILIHTTDGPRKLVQSIRAAQQSLKNGELLAIWPEGRLTRTGDIETFHKGFEKIAEGTGAPVIPIHMSNLWGSIFSCKNANGEPGLRFPRHFGRRRVVINIGKPLPPNATAYEAREAVMELAADTATADATRSGQTLGNRFIANARRHFFRHIISDTLGMRMNFAQLLTAAIMLGKRLNAELRDEPRVGVLLPTTVAGITVNAALTITGKCAVNLNHTIAPQMLLSAVSTSGIKTVITSNKVLEKITLPELPVRFVTLEELATHFTAIEKVKAFLLAAFAPARWLCKNRDPQAEACVIFSSGSTGIPKGVVLTHANLLGDLESIPPLLNFSKTDLLLGSLPLFHSFGYLVCVWVPLLVNVSIVCHPNPLQTAKIIDTIRKNRVTLMISTPTLLQTLARKATREDLSSLRIVVAGGEKLNPAQADAFERDFGIRPLEGFGATELSPVAALSLPNQRLAREKVIGNKPGSIGRPLPNVAVKIVNPETGAPCGVNESGLMLVKGPNVMNRYLNDPERTAEAIHDGWYNTGDIAKVDSDGFIFLTDRLSRFSKIGAEMVPHGAVEAALRAGLENAGPCVAVAGGRDAQTDADILAVFYTAAAGTAETLCAKLRANGIPNLWIPKLANFHQIQEIPLLATGKIDYVALKNML